MRFSPDIYENGPAPTAAQVDRLARAAARLSSAGARVGRLIFVQAGRLVSLRAPHVCVRVALYEARWIVLICTGQCRSQWQILEVFDGIDAAIARFERTLR